MLSNTDKLYMLEIVNKNPAIKEEMEKFINDNNYTIAQLKASGSTYDFFESIFEKLDSLCYNLSDKYNIDKNCLVMYFAMDKLLYGKIKFWSKNRYSNEFVFIDKNNNNSRFNLSGETIRKAYDNANAEVIEFLNVNIELLPESTKKYILNQEKKNKKQPGAKMQMKLLSNDFEAKAFSKSLPDILNLTYLKRYFNFIKNNQKHNSSTQTLSLVYLHNSLSEAYPSQIEDKLKQFSNSVLIKIFDNLSETSNNTHLSKNNVPAFFTALRKILKSDLIINFIFSRLEEKNVLALTKILSKYARSVEHKKIIDKNIRELLFNTYYHSILPFDTCSEELQKLMIKEALENSKYVDCTQIWNEIKVPI